MEPRVLVRCAGSHRYCTGALGLPRYGGLPGELLCASHCTPVATVPSLQNEALYLCADIAGTLIEAGLQPSLGKRTCTVASNPRKRAKVRLFAV